MSLQNRHNIKTAIAVNTRYSGFVKAKSLVPANDLFPTDLLQEIVDAISEMSEQVFVLEADGTFCQEILKIKPDCVMNFSYGLQGNSRQSHIPSILEMLGIDYLGSDPYVHALLLNKTHTKILVEKMGISVPKGKLIDKTQQLDEIENWPCYIAKPNEDMNSNDVYCVDNPDDLKKIVNKIIDKYGKCLVEEYIPGTDVTVGILGTQQAAQAFLPLEFLSIQNGVRSKKSKKNEIKCACPPVSLDDKLVAQLQEYSLRIHNELGCLDFSRVDYRVGDDGKVFFLEINSSPGLTVNSPFPKAALNSGFSSRKELFQSLLYSLLERTSELDFSFCKNIRSGVI